MTYISRLRTVQVVSEPLVFRCVKSFPEENSGAANRPVSIVANTNRGEGYYLRVAGVVSRKDFAAEWPRSKCLHICNVV